MTTEKFSRILALSVVGTLSAIVLATATALTYAFILKPLFSI